MVTQGKYPYKYPQIQLCGDCWLRDEIRKGKMTLWQATRYFSHTPKTALETKGRAVGLDLDITTLDLHPTLSTMSTEPEIARLVLCDDDVAPRVRKRCVINCGKAHRKLVIYNSTHTPHVFQKALLCSSRMVHILRPRPRVYCASYPNVYYELAVS